MKNLYLLSLVLSLLSLDAFSQRISIPATSVTTGYSEKPLQERFSEYHVYQIDVSRPMEAAAQLDGHVVLNLSFDGGVSWEADLVKVQLRDQHFRLRIKTPAGVEEPTPIVAHTFQGSMSAGGLVALTIAHDFLYGFFELGDVAWYIEPVWLMDPGALRDRFVVYRAADVIPGGELRCAAKDTERIPLPKDIDHDRGVNSCLEAQVALASDYMLFTTLGSTSAVEAWALGNLNNVAVNYRHEFADNIELILVEHFVDSALPEEWTTSTDPGVLLDSFTAWGPTHFANPHDLATLWTGRDLDGSTVGIAWVDAVCSAYRYNVCQYLGVAWQDRVLQAHEMGHNFGAGHDPSGSPYIMAPAINNTDDWSSTSVSTINGDLPGFTCLTTCTGAPTAAFLADPVVICTGGTVQFKDKSINGATRTWTFQNGTPSNSTAQQPSVTYSANGSHDVTITSIGVGSNTLTQADYIIVDDPTTASCTTSGGSGGLTFFSLANISNISGTGSYSDFSCSDLTTLAPGTSYGLAVTIYCASSGDYKGIRFFIDYNNDGDMSDPGELVASSTYMWCGGIVDQSDEPGLAFTTSSSPVTGQILRARVIVHKPYPSTDPCQTLTLGEAEDYGVYFPSAPLPVELITFTAERAGSTVMLSWTTATETNSSHFTVERATLGTSFEDLGTVPAKGNSDHLNHYTFVDPAPLDGVNYYRLRQTDLDGSEEFSGVVAVKFNHPAFVKLVPNPAAEQVEVLNGQRAGVIHLNIFSTTGRLLRSQAFDGQPIQLQGLPPGIYLVELELERKVVHTRLVVK